MLLICTIGAIIKTMKVVNIRKSPGVSLKYPLIPMIPTLASPTRKVPELVTTAVEVRLFFTF
jgi:hypothetical protein